MDAGYIEALPPSERDIYFAMFQEEQEKAKADANKNPNQLSIGEPTNMPL